MDIIQIKVEEECEQKPIGFPDVLLPPRVEIHEIAVKQEEENIKQEEAEKPLPQIVAIFSNGKCEHDVKEETAQRLSPSETEHKPPTAEDLGHASVKVEDSYDCEFCGEKFARKPRLSKHILSTHLDELLLKCPQCDVQFANKRALASHQKFHTGEKFFCCGRCGEAFKYVSNYVSHMNDHMGAQSYECGECGAGFSTKRRVRLHVDTHHSGFWPFVCPLCLKPFLKKSKFLRHQKVHAAETENGLEAAHT